MGTLSDSEVELLRAPQTKDSVTKPQPPTKRSPRKKKGKAVSAAAKELLFTNVLIDSLREMFNLEEEDFTVATREVEVMVTEEVPEEAATGQVENGGNTKDTAAEQPPKLKEQPMDEDVETEMMEEEMPAKRLKKREVLRRETHKIVAFKVDFAETAGEPLQKQTSFSTSAVEVDITSKQLLQCEQATVRTMVSRLLAASCDISL